MAGNEKYVAYLGPEGTYSGKAAKIVAAQTGAKLIPYGSIEEVANKVSVNTLGIFPYYSALEGWVSESLSLINDNQFQIIDAHRVPVKPSVGKYPGTDDKAQKRVYSHRKALALCSDWLNRNYPGISRVPVESTGAGADRVSKEHSGLALADIEALHLCVLDVVHREIVTSFTDFYVATPVYTDIPNLGGGYRTAIVIIPRIGEASKTGVMQYVVNLFGVHDRPIIKSISMPRPRESFEPEAQVFFFEFEGHKDDQGSKALLEALPLSKLIEEVKVLGTYPRLAMHSGILTPIKTEIPPDIQ